MVRRLVVCIIFSANISIFLCYNPLGAAEGDSLWSRTFGGADADYAFSVVEASDGGYLLAGETHSFGAGFWDMWLICLEGHTSAVKPKLEYTPFQYICYPPFPNPFNPVTAIGYQLPLVSFVNLTVYNGSGRKVAELVSGWRAAGYHEVTWDASNLASGVYLYRIEAVDYTAVKKMVLMK